MEGAGRAFEGRGFGNLSKLYTLNNFDRKMFVINDIFNRVCSRHIAQLGGAAVKIVLYVCSELILDGFTCSLGGERFIRKTYFVRCLCCHCCKGMFVLNPFVQNPKS